MIFAIKITKTTEKWQHFCYLCFALQDHNLLFLTIRSRPLTIRTCQLCSAIREWTITNLLVSNWKNIKYRFTLKVFMQKPPTKRNAKAKISNSITPDLLISFSLNFQSNTLYSLSHALLKKNSLGWLLPASGQGTVLKRQISQSATRRGCPSSRSSSAPTFVQLCS